MTRWQRAEQDTCILAVTLLNVSEMQGVLEYIVDFTKHIHVNLYTYLVF
jgi:hypothetical protein